MGTVILGGGIIGVSVAYYLSELVDKPSSIHIIETSSTLFPSASGYAAGFLAKDWFADSSSELGALSFSLHKSLASEHNGKQRWGYSPSKALSLAFQQNVGVGTGQRGEDWLLNGTSRATTSAAKDVLDAGGSPAWLTRQKSSTLEVISTEDGCAQVDPLRLCQFLMEECRKRGVQLHHPARAVSIIQDGDGKISGVRLQGPYPQTPASIRSQSLVIASGGWTASVFKELFPRSIVDLPISSIGGYSLIVKSPRHTPAQEAGYGMNHAIFAAPNSTCSWAPEIFSRQGGEIYIAGLNAPEVAVPPTASEAAIDAAPMDELKRVAVELMGQRVSQSDSKSDAVDVGDLEVTREALCFRPVTARGTPIVTKLPDGSLGDNCASQSGGVFVAAGHGPWGISLSLGTGKVMAEMIQGIKTSANIDLLGL